MKRKVVILTAFALVALLVAGGTMAWFTGTARANIEYKAGTIKVEVNNGLKGLKQNTYLNPGDCFKGDITFKNTGNKRAYLRVKLTSIWEGTQEGANTDNVAEYDILKKQKTSGHRDETISRKRRMVVLHEDPTTRLNKPIISYFDGSMDNKSER